MIYNPYISNFLRIAIILLLQFLILKILPVPPLGIINVLPLIILMLPVSLSTSLILVLAFVIGMLADFIELHPGLYTAPLLVVAWIRNSWLQMLLPPFQDIQETEENFRNNRFPWYLFYIGVPVLLFELIFAVVLKLDFSFATLGFALLKTLYDLPFQFLLLYLLYK